MARIALSAEEAEFIGNLCHYVREHLDSFRETGKRLDERFSAAAFQQHHDEQVEGFRRARAPKFDNDLNCQVPTDEPMYSEGFIEAARAGHVPTLPADRMGRAMAECASVQADDAVDTELAEIVCVLTWLAWDQHANEIQPHICEFQKMEWRFDPLYTGCDRRQLHKDRVDSSWVTLARKSLSLVKLRLVSIMPARPKPPSPVVGANDDALPEADRWLRDCAPLIAANLSALRDHVVKEEEELRRRWKAERMVRVRRRRDELRQHVRHHPDLLPPEGQRASFFRRQLREEFHQPVNHATAIYMAAKEAIERSATLYCGRPFSRSFAAWVEFLLFIILNEAAGNAEHMCALQHLSNDWPGRTGLLIDLKHSGLLDKLLGLDERAWVVIAPLVDQPEVHVRQGRVGAALAKDAEAPSAPRRESGNQRQAASSTRPHESAKSWSLAFKRDRKRRLRAAHIRWKHPTSGDCVEATIRGPSRTGLVAMVFASPDQDLPWGDLLAHALDREYLSASNCDSLRRVGSDVSKALPPSLRGYWSQSVTGVRWNSPPGFQRLETLPLAEGDDA